MSAYSKDLNGKGPIQNPAAGEAETPIRVDGFAQVLEMLRVADPAFRESLLRRLAARDRDLARDLRADLAGF
jgi:hypothetical protein